MAPIPPPEMGDVWPAVEPGLEPSDYGSATLAPVEPCVVRSLQTLTITYTVGRFGLDDTGGIMVGWRWVHDCGPFQVTDPLAQNYISATSSTGVPLTLFVEPYGYRPWTCALRVTVTGGYLSEGDTITIVLGDTSGGGPGLRMQTIAEAAWEMKVSVDACATGHFNPLPDVLSIPVIAGLVERWCVVAPGRRQPGQPFSVGLRVEDAWGNPALLPAGKIGLTADRPVHGLPPVLDVPAGQRSLCLSGLSAEAGPIRVYLSRAGEALATSNPIVISDDHLQGYWGDLHGQSGETVGVGTIEEYMAYAKEIAFLDVTGHQANDFQITNAFWMKINATTAALDESGSFVVFPGYEWSGNTPVGGDHNVFFRQEGRQIRRSSHAMLSDRSDLETDANTLDSLFDALKGEDVVLWSHVGGRPADVSYAHDPHLKTAVEVHSNWGTFEWILTDSLALGHKVGVVANSDGHKGRPGAGPPGATEFGAYGGLTCFLASELSREALFECMRRRHHYGTSGSRIGLDVRVALGPGGKVYPKDPRYGDVAPVPTEVAIMGDIAETTTAPEVLVTVSAPAPIERVDILDGPALVETRRTYGAVDLGDRVRVYWQGAEYRGRGRNTLWQGTLTTIGADILSATPINHWNPERPVQQTAPNQVSFEAVTSGNYAGVDLELSTLGALSVASNLVSGNIDLLSLGVEDIVLDAGGLERQIRVRRLPDRIARKDWSTNVPIQLTPGSEGAVWVRVTTTDGHQAWSSPIYLTRH